MPSLLSGSKILLYRRFIARQAVADGYIEEAERFKDLVEAVLRRAV